MMSNLKRSSTTRRILHAASSERLQAVAEPRCWPPAVGDDPDGSGSVLPHLVFELATRMTSTST